MEDDSPHSTSPSISITPCFHAPPSGPSHNFAPSTFLMIQAASSGVSSDVSLHAGRSKLTPLDADEHHETLSY